MYMWKLIIHILFKLTYIVGFIILASLVLKISEFIIEDGVNITFPIYLWVGVVCIFMIILPYKSITNFNISKEQITNNFNSYINKISNISNNQ